MKTKRQILEWLSKQPWKGEFYEAMFLDKASMEVYDKNFLRYSFHWRDTAQGVITWAKRDKEYREWYKSDRKSNVPRSWEEYCEQNPITKDDWCIEYGEVCEVFDQRFYTTEQERDPMTCIDVMPKEHCEAFVAYMKLFQLRNAWVKDCDDANMNYRIIASNCKIYIKYCCVPKMGLSFPTQEMADEFADVFKDLLETAKPLL